MATDELLAVELFIGDDRAELVIDGELDMCNADLVEHHVTACADEAGVASIVLDLRGVTFCDGAGYQALVRGRRCVAAREVRCEVRPSRAVLRVAGILGDLVGRYDLADAHA